MHSVQNPREVLKFKRKASKLPTYIYSYPALEQQVNMLFTQVH
jgi:hypothetical protein